MSQLKDAVNKNQASLDALKEKANKTITSSKRNIIFGIGIFVMIMFMGAFAMQIIAGIVALILVAVFVPFMIWGSYAIKKADPLIRQKINNEVLKRQIEEAQKNGLSQLRNSLIEDAQEITLLKEKKGDVNGKIRQCQAESQKDLKEYGEESDTYKMSAGMVVVLEKAKGNLEKLIELRIKQAEEFEAKLKEAERKQELADIANEITDIVGADLSDKLDEMLDVQAFKSIESNYHDSIAHLENVLEDQI